MHKNHLADLVQFVCMRMLSSFSFLLVEWEKVKNLPFGQQSEMNVKGEHEEKLPTFQKKLQEVMHSFFVYVNVC
jgi:hypothetical protein